MLLSDEQTLDITLHKFQLEAYDSTKRITALVSGIQGGKTCVGGIWMNRRVALFDDPGVNFIVAAPTFKLLEKSTLPWMLYLLKGHGYHDKKFNRFHLNRGGTIWFASMQDDDSVEGCTDVQGIWIDEAGKIRYNSWINLLARSSFLQCPIFITTTPYNLNWLYEDLYMPWRKGERDDVHVVQFRSCDNPYFPKEEYEHQRKILDSRVFKRKYGGTFERMSGLVYPDITADNFCEPTTFNRKRFLMCGGVDFGFTNDFAITIRAISLDGTYDYQIDEFAKPFVELKQRAEILKQFTTMYGIEVFYCDSEDPTQINYLQNEGINAVGVEKGKGSVERGILLHTELINTNKHKMFKGKCRKTAEEYGTYHYAENVKKDKNEVEKPVSKNDHLMDANRYVTMETRYIWLDAEENKKYKKWVSPIEEFKNTDPQGGGSDNWYYDHDKTTII